MDMLRVVAMKRNPNRKFAVTKEDGDHVWMVELEKETNIPIKGTEKKIKQITAKRSYNVVSESENTPVEIVTEEFNPDETTNSKSFWIDGKTKSVIMANSQEAIDELVSLGYTQTTEDEYEKYIRSNLLQTSQEKEKEDISLESETSDKPAIPDNITEDKENIKEEPGESSESENNIKPTEWELQPKQPNRSAMREDRDSRLKDAKPFTPDPFYLRQSMLNSYMQCPKKFYEVYENGLYEESKFTKMGTAVHGVMEDYYLDPSQDVEELFGKWWAKYGPEELGNFKACLNMVLDYLERNPYKPNIIALELEFQTSINGVPVSGTIDRIDRIDEETIRIIDYKTNHRPWTRAELEESIQFQMYVSALQQPNMREKIGHFSKVECTYEMLRLGYSQTISYDQDTLNQFGLWLNAIWTKILSGVDREPKFNQYCGYCPMKDTCPVFKDKLENIDEVADDAEIATLVEQRETLKNQEKLLKVQLREVDTRIKEEISNFGGEITIGDRVWITRSQERKMYPADKLIQILTMHGHADKLAELVQFKSTAIKKTFADNQELLNIIESVAETHYTAPSIASRKK